jgi:hypothetical protein
MVNLFAAQQPRQLGDVGGDPPRFVTRHQVRRRAPAGFVLEIDVGQRVPVGVADDEAVLAELGIGVVDRPRRREAAGLGQEVARADRRSHLEEL